MLKQLQITFSISDRWITLALVACSLSIPGIVLTSGMWITVDDGFYYLKIAQYIAQGVGSTFDGKHVTNGYQPLWLLCLVPIFWLSSAPDTALTISIVLQGIAAAGAVALIYHIARLQYGRPAASMAALLWIWITYPVALVGMEWSLLALCLLATTYVYLRWCRLNATASPLPYLLLGLLMSLTFLARIDTLALACLIGLFIAGRELRAGITGAGLRRLIAFGAPVIAVVVGYIAVNVGLFGHPWPISGVVKRMWSLYLFANEQQSQPQHWAVSRLSQLFWPFHGSSTLFSLSVALGTYGVGGLWLASALGGHERRWSQWFNQMLWPWSPLILFSLLHFGSYALVYHEVLSVARWYYVAQHVLTVLLIAGVAHWLITNCATIHHAARLGLWRRMLLLTVVVVWCGVSLSIGWSVKRWHDETLQQLRTNTLYTAAQWVNAHLPADAVIGSWNAGTISYVSGRRVVNLDGLVNSWDYYESERFDLCRYWQAASITYLVDMFDQKQGPSLVPIYPYYQQCSDRFELLWSDHAYFAPWRMTAYRLHLDSR
jgi:hypothetical protein